MRIAIENTELYRYEIHALIKAFCPEEDVKVRVKGQITEREKKKGRLKSENDPDPFITFDFFEEKIEIVLYPQNEDAVTAASAEAFSVMKRTIPAPEGIRLNEKGKTCKDLLKHAIYRLLADYFQRELPWGELIGIRPTKIAMQELQSGKSGEQAARMMVENYSCSEEKALLAADIAQRERKILSGIHYEDGYSLYIGIPFCPTTCLYCSFTSFPIASWRDRVDEYLKTLALEMKESAQMMQGKILDTVYIGGGTPTTPEPDQLDYLLSSLKKYFPMENVREFTVEAGRADSITKDKLRVLKEHGVGRISVNPQTMNDRTLKLIGRQHNVQQVREAFADARDCGFTNINMDIILGLPEETEEDIRYTIDEIVKMDPDSLTVHSLALKRASRMQMWIEKNGFSSIRNTDDCMRIAAKGAERMNMNPYYLYRQKNMSGNFENTGYAREGKEGIYNILIMEEKQSILALGAGSISKAVFPGGRIERSDNCKDVATYISNIDEMIRRKEKLYHI